MKALMEEMGAFFVDCVPAGIIIAMFLALLTNGAIRDTVQRFVENIC